jgi:hypothetical protein
MSPNQYVILSVEDNGRLVDRHIRASVLRHNPLHQNHFAYQVGKYRKSTLNNVMM